jgi:hypothetical protein
MNPEISAFIDKIAQPWQAEICKALHNVVLAAVPDAEERMMYSKPHYKKGKEYVAVIGTAKAHVSFTIFNAQALQPPEGMFESSDTGDRKTIKFKEGQTVDSALLTALVKQASG